MSQKNAKVDIPFNLSKFPDGDDNSYHWSTMVSKGTNQFLYSIKSEWQLPSKGETLRCVIQFFYTYMDKIAELEGGEVSPRLVALKRYLASRKAKQEYDQLQSELYQHYLEAQSASTEELKQEMMEAGEAMALLNNMPWPPKAPPLIEYDLEAKYVYGRVRTELGRAEEGRINMRTLVRNSSWDQDALLEVLGKLRDEGYVHLSEEKRSGLPTLWITIPTLH